MLDIYVYLVYINTQGKYFEFYFFVYMHFVYLQSMYLWYMYMFHMWVCVYMCASAHVCAHTWKVEVNIGCLPLFFFTLLCEIGSLTEPEARQLVQSSPVPLGSRNASLSFSSFLVYICVLLHQALMQVPRIQTQLLMLAWQVLYRLSHLPRP